MSIVLIEDFRNDTAQSILTKYPGSARGSDFSYADGWPLGLSRVFKTSIPTTGFDRVEILLEFDPLSTPGISTTSALSIFGLTLQTLTGTKSLLNGVEINSAQDSSGLSRLQLIAERGDYQWAVYVLSDTGMREKFWLTSITWTNSINCVELPILPSKITRIVVAHDEAAGSVFDTVTLEDASIQATNSGNWVYTDQGFVQDTDKSDPSVEDPYIWSPPDSGVITFSPVDETYDAVAYTIAGRGGVDSTGQAILGVGSDSFGMSNFTKSRLLVDQDLSLKLHQPAFEVIAQPVIPIEWNNKNLADLGEQYATIDNYAANQYTSTATFYSQAGPFGDQCGHPITWSLEVGDLNQTVWTLELFLKTVTTVDGRADLQPSFNCGLGLIKTGTEYRLVISGVNVIFSDTSRILDKWIFMAVVYEPLSTTSLRATGWAQNVAGSTTATQYRFQGTRSITGTKTTMDWGGTSSKYVSNIRLTKGMRYDPSAATIPIPQTPWPQNY